MIEIIAVMSIFLMVAMAGGDFVTNGFRSIIFNDEQETAIEHARRALESISLDLREAQRSERGDYPIKSASSQDFIWYGDNDNDNQTEMIRYVLSSANLLKITTEPGADNSYSSPSATTTIAEYVNNQTEPIFSFFDANNASTSIINDIRLVNIRLKINVTPWRAPGDYYLESDVQLRNLKDNL